MSWWNPTRALETKSIFGFKTTIAPAATAAASAVEQAFTVPVADLPPGVKLKATDIVTLVGPASGNNVTIGARRINATGQLVIQFVNPTAGALTHATGVFYVMVARL